jgi:hypothetical protein
MARGSSFGGHVAPIRGRGRHRVRGGAPVGGGHRSSADIERDNTTMRSIWARERMNSEGARS